jgi:hypothetical protein
MKKGHHQAQDKETHELPHRAGNYGAT